MSIAGLECSRNVWVWAQQRSVAIGFDKDDLPENRLRVEVYRFVGDLQTGTASESIL